MSRIVSHYRLRELLGEGGTGQVWKAEDLKLNRTVAIKLLTPELAGDQDARDFIRNEARAAAALNHPNIATVHELGETDDGFYIAMEYVDGENLESRLARGPLQIEVALEVSIQVADALSAAHAVGLVHGDVKSSNIIITSHAGSKLLDFGLVRRISPPGLAISRSHPGNTSASAHTQETNIEICGTPAYMSPEQIRGEPLDQRTDIFSLGVVLFEMLTGNQPFAARTAADSARAVLNNEPLPLSAFRDDAPLELESIIRAATAKKRGDRYATAEHFRAAMQRFKGALDYRVTRESSSSGAGPGDLALEPHSSSPASSPVDPLSRLRSLAWRHRRLLILAGALAGLGAVWEMVHLQSAGGGWQKVGGALAIAAASILSYALAQPRVVRDIAKPTTALAFRGLLPFQEADRSLFYGRETETAALSEMIRHSEFRFGVLFGESGCGKTSLLRAGLIPRLWEEGYVPIYCRSYRDPVAVALAECERRSHLTRAAAEPPSDYLKRVAREFGATLIIVCDQFEEFFISHRTRQDRDPFLAFIAACQADCELPVKFLASMRSDFLYLISSELGGRISEPLLSSRLYHLHNFDQEQAEQIITRSALRAGLPLEEGLSTQVARDLAREEIVLPSEMQIVGEQLQRKRIYTHQAYKRAGGKEPLVHGFLEDVIKSSGDAQDAGLLLRSLVSEENTRLTLTVDQICSRTQRTSGSVERLLRLFVDARLIREIQEDEPWRYELMHEYLIDRVNRITGRVMDATQRANRLLRQYLANHSVDGGDLIPVSKLWFIKRHSGLQLGRREREFLNRSIRWGLLRSAAAVLFLAVLGVIAGAAFSVTEEWEGVRLSDGHTAAARKAAFSPDGRLLVTCGEDGRVIVWDFARRQKLATFEETADWVNSVAFSPDGRWFATTGADNTVAVWDAIGLERVAVLSGHPSRVEVVAFSRDGRWLSATSGGPEGRTIIFDMNRWERAFEIPRGLTWGDATFSPDGTRMLIGGEIWDLQTDRLINTLDPGSTFCAFSRDQRLLVGVDGTGAVTFYDPERIWTDGRAPVLKTQRLHQYHGRAAAVSPDGKLAASAAEDIVLWDAQSKAKLVRLKYPAQVWSIAFSPDGRWLVSTHDDGAVLLWDVAEREVAASFDGHSASVHSVAFSPDGRYLASASEDRSVILWDVLSGAKEAILTGHSNRVTSVAFSSDAKLLATADMDSNLFIWDVNDRKRKWATRYLNRGKDWIATYCVAFSPDGRYLAATPGVYDTSTGRQLVNFYDLVQTYRIPWGGTYGVAFSPDGRRLLCATDTGYLLMWDVETWQLIGYVQRSPTPLISLSFAPDGSHLVTGDDEGSVRLWEVVPLREIALIGRHEARIKQVVFSPDGSRVASCSDDQVISLWDVGARSLVKHIGTHTAPVLSVTFSPDGHRLACGEQQRSVRLYTRHRALWGFRLD